MFSKLRNSIDKCLIWNFTIDDVKPLLGLKLESNSDIDISSNLSWFFQSSQMFKNAKFFVENWTNNW